MNAPNEGPRARGPIAWMAQNAVAANLLMGVLVVGGILASGHVKQEVFPEFELDMIQIGVPYPGASPAEVEQGVILAVEEAVRGVDGVKRLTASAVEHAAGITVELELGTDNNKALSDVKSAIDRVTTLPVDAERPVVSLLSNRRDVISVVLYGDQEEEVLRQLAENAREELLAHPDVTYVEMSGVRPREIAIEVSQANLRRYNLTLERVAQEVGRSTVELPGGTVKTSGGEVLLRTAERRDLGAEFRELPIISTAEGTAVRLGEVAQVVDGFQETDTSASFDGKPAVMINVFRTGEQTPIEVADAVFAFVAKAGPELPPGVAMATLNDRSEMYRDRVDLLLRNARQGLVLVLLVLGLFLSARLAFWVTMGIPISFLGALLLMPYFDVSVNMISLFAFLVTLGIVVDDAIVVGENIFEMRQRGATLMDAAVKGAQQIAMPVVFSVLTTVVAFTPLFLVPGAQGKFFRFIPMIVVFVLIISLVESLFILPAHLGHRGHFFTNLWRTLSGPFRKAPLPPLPEDDEAMERLPPGPVMRALGAPQRWFSGRLHQFITNRYGPAVDLAVRRRYLTIACGVAMLALTFGYVKSGRVQFTFMPRVEADNIVARATLPFGVTVEESEAVRDRLLAAAREVLERNGGDAISRGVFTQVGQGLSGGMGGPGGGRGSATGSHLAGVQVFLVPSDKREIGAADFAKQWREKVRDLVGLESLTFSFSTGPGAGAALEIELAHRDLEVLEAASTQLAGALTTFAGVRDVDDGFSDGKPQLDFKLKPLASSLGLTATDVGRQVRSAFFGAEVLRQQRGRDEVRVMVRRPESERRSEHDIEGFLVRTPDGGEVPLSAVAEVERGKSYTQIKRADGRRVVTVTGDIIPGEANAEKVQEALAEKVMPTLVGDFPGLTYSFEGESRRSRESLAALGSGFIMALFGIFALLAVPFKSYIQPVVVMVAIPFGAVGALIGHVIMGYDASLISMMGVVAVSGIVVNDSLVMVHAANELRAEGLAPHQAILQAGMRRFRPILLTSLTTFFGLAPMIFETSVQARFLVPMAVSLGFGVLFATYVILLLVPAVYMAVEDLRGLLERREVPAPPEVGGERASAQVLRR